MGIFSATLKHICRNGKDQITFRPSGNREILENNGESKSDSISFELRNTQAFVWHYYTLVLDWNNARHNFNSFANVADYTNAINYPIIVDGIQTTYANMPPKSIINLLLCVLTLHIA